MCVTVVHLGNGGAPTADTFHPERNVLRHFRKGEFSVLTLRRKEMNRFQLKKAPISLEKVPFSLGLVSYFKLGHKIS